MSVEANKAVVRRLIDEIMDGGNYDIYDDVVADELIHRRPGLKQTFPLLPGVTPPDESAPYKERFRQAMEIIRRSFPDWRTHTQELVAEGDTVVGRYTVTGTHPGRFAGVGKEEATFSADMVVVFRLVGGRVHEMWGLTDELGLWRQLGLEIP